jgi:DNA polymerase III delta subunit
MARPSGADPLATLREGEPGPLYFLYGKERYLLDRAVDLLRARVLDPRTRDFNYELFYGKEAGAGSLT